VNQVTHVHYCKHCDSTCSCKLPNCIFDYEISKYHDCGEHEVSNRKFKRSLSDYESCKFGCKTLPCIHNKWPQRKKPDNERYFELPEHKRPQILNNYFGKQLILAKENKHSVRNRPAYVKATDDAITTSYISDGNNLDYAMSVQRKWIAAKVQRIADTFPEHLRKLVKEMRGQ